MPLTDEQAKGIKQQLLKQAESFPEDKREQVKEYINSMNNQQLEEFLIKNKMMSESGEMSDGEEETKEEKGKPQCVMCLISGKKIESLAIYEDKDYLAALEINPFSKGHIILIPKKHLTETKLLKSKAFTIANRIGKHLVSKLKAENFQITSSDELKHAIINIIPKYKDQKITFERKPAKKEELNDLAMKIGKIEKKQKAIKIKTEKTEDKKESKIETKKSNILQFSRRIP
jgi:histidine triad (HIT) family protein